MKLRLLIILNWLLSWTPTVRYLNEQLDAEKDFANSLRQNITHLNALRRDLEHDVSLLEEVNGRLITTVETQRAQIKHLGHVNGGLKSQNVQLKKRLAKN